MPKGKILAKFLNERIILVLGEEHYHFVPEHSICIDELGSDIEDFDKLNCSDIIYYDDYDCFITLTKEEFLKLKEVLE